jgi:hypothetical protein
MSTEAYRRAGNIYLKVTQVPAAERETFLDQNCDDNQIRGLVEDMLRDEALSVTQPSVNESKSVGSEFEATIIHGPKRVEEAVGREVPTSLGRYQIRGTAKSRMRCLKSSRNPARPSRNSSPGTSRLRRSRVQRVPRNRSQPVRKVVGAPHGYKPRPSAERPGQNSRSQSAARTRAESDAERPGTRRPGRRRGTAHGTRLRNVNEDFRFQVTPSVSKGLRRQALQAERLSPSKLTLIDVARF